MQLPEVGMRYVVLLTTASGAGNTLLNQQLEI